MKNIIIPIIALLLIFGFGIYENVCIKKTYIDFKDEIARLIVLSDDEKLTEEIYSEFEEKWLKVREKSEFFLPHNDVYEMNLRISETKAYIKYEDYEMCTAQLHVMLDLADYISHLAMPSVQHIF